MIGMCLVIFVRTMMTFATRTRACFCGKFLAKIMVGFSVPDNIFNELSLFHDLSDAQKYLLRLLFVYSLEPVGTVIFEQGNPAENLYLVVEGEVAIRFKPEDGPSIIVARVRREGVAGWSAALGSPAYTSSAVCAEDCRLLRVRSQDLRQLCEQHPEVGTIILERLAAVIAERLCKNHQHVLAMLENGLNVHVARPVAAG
jgi:CRP-like cAMP-binding protein